MPRYTKAMELSEFKSEFNRLLDKLDFEGEDKTIYNLVTEFLTPTLQKDLSKFNFYCENLIEKATDLTFKDTPYFDFPLLGYQEFNGISFLGLIGGSDYGLPLFFILYIDDKNRIRGYLPSKGNAVNPLSKSTFGEDNVKDDLYFQSKGFVDMGDFLSKDNNHLLMSELLLKDILTRIIAK